jgi:glycerate dehydrogenase
VRAAFLDFASLGPEDLDCGALTRSLPGIALHGHTAPAELPARVAGRELLIVNKTRLDAAAMAAAPGLRLICAVATGTDNIDLDAARARGIAVYNIRDYCTAAVVQHVFALVLALTQRLAEWRALLSAGGWSRSQHFCLLDYPFGELAGRTLGVVGMGQLGSGVARMGAAFGMRVVAAHSHRPGDPDQGGSAAVERVALDELLASAHVVSLHCPLTPATHRLIDTRALALMRADALLVNTARGGLVDSAALLAALKSGRLGGAGIDVLPEEPPPADEPLLNWQSPRLLVTPHVAWAAREARQRALDQVLENIADWQAGRTGRRVA